MSAATSAPGPGHDLRAVTPYPPAVSIVLSPQHSVVTLLRQAARGQSRGAPAGLLAGIGDALRPQARFAAQSFSGPGWMPETSAPIPPLADASVADHAAQLRDMPAAALTDELHAADCCRDFPPHRHECLQYFRAAGDQPRRWLSSMADASLDVWAVAEPRWRAAGPLLDREIRRIATAAVRGGLTALLNSLHPRLKYYDGTFAYAWASWHREVIHYPVGARRLALLPMIAGRDELLLGFERPDICYIGYPLRQPSPGQQATIDGTLATVLGPVRAAILRALRQPLTVNALAAAAQCAPTTATYHLHQLAAAGLITREKSGLSVRVSRTARGHELVDLLSD
jgi:DNA-binding transcriptional ArsR family regulator